MPDQCVISTVCCLSAGKGAFVLSSSWDKSAKLWHVGEQRCVLTLTGHELTVWSVLQLPDTGVIATGSADRTVRIYGPDGGYLRTLNGTYTHNIRFVSSLNCRIVVPHVSLPGFPGRFIRPRAVSRGLVLISSTSQFSNTLLPILLVCF